MTMVTPTYDGAAEERVAWLADRATQAFRGDVHAAHSWLEQPRRDLAGFTPSQCALLGGAPLHRVSRLLERMPFDDRPVAATRHETQLVASG